MKRIVSISAIALLTATGAFAAQPSHIARDGKGGYDVLYSYKDKPKTGWYAGARAELSFLNWKYKFEREGNPADSDKHSFEPVFGGSLAFGKKIQYFWRAELEAGFLGYHSQDDEGAKLKLSLPYAMLNGYYDFTNGLYLGAGVGVSVPVATSSVYQGNNVANEDTYTTVSPMAGLMLGFSHKLDDNIVLDLRYRLSGMMGFTQDQMVSGDKLEIKTDFILDNSISIGLRYEF